MHQIMKRVAYCKSRPKRHGLAFYITQNNNIIDEIYDIIIGNVIDKLGELPLGKITDKTTHLLCDLHSIPDVPDHVRIIRFPPLRDIYHVFTFQFYSSKSKQHKVWNAAAQMWMNLSYLEDVYCVSNCTIRTTGCYAIDTTNGPPIEFYYGTVTLQYTPQDRICNLGMYLSAHVINRDAIQFIPFISNIHFVGGMDEYTPVRELDPNVKYRNDLAGEVIRQERGPR